MSVNVFLWSFLLTLNIGGWRENFPIYNTLKFEHVSGVKVNLTEIIKKPRHNYENWS